MTGELRRNEYAALKVVCKWKVNKQILVGRADHRLLNIADNIARLKNRYCAGGLVILKESRSVGQHFVHGQSTRGRIVVVCRYFEELLV